MNFWRLSIAPGSPTPEAPPYLPLCFHSRPFIRLAEIFLRSFWLGGKLSSEEQPQWLWLYNTRFAEGLVAFALILRMPKLKLVLQLEDMPAARLANSGLRGWLDGISTFLLSRHAHSVFAVSIPVAQAFNRITRFPLGHISLLPPLLDDSYQDQLAKRTSPFSNSIYTIVYAGGYSSEKGVDDLICAFRQLRPKLYRLLLLGPIPDKLKASLTGIQDITILGMVPDRILFSSYVNADVIVNPHRPILNSGHIFPFKLIEIMASGSLPLSTAMPGLDSYGLPGECLFSGSTELAAKLSDAPAIWARNRSQLKDLATRVRQRHSVEKAKDSLRQLFG